MDGLLGARGHHGLDALPGQHRAQDPGQVGVVLHDERGAAVPPLLPSTSPTASLDRGSVNQNVAPRPGSLSTQMRPPCCSTIERAIGRPESGAALLARVGGVDLAEALEDRLQLVGRDAAAVVGHAEQHRVGGRGGR